MTTIERESFWPAYLPADLHFMKGERPLFEYLTEHSKDEPDRPAIVFYNRVITYKEWDDMSNSVAQFLVAAGVKKQDRVALFMPTFPGFLIAYMGISKMGGIAVTCSTAFKEDELEYQLQDSGAEVIFCLDHYMGTFKRVFEKLHLKKVILTGYRDFFDSSQADNVPDEIRKSRSCHEGTVELLDIFRNYPSTALNVPIDLHSDIALIKYTGGTTGLPKGAILSHFGVIYKTACRVQINYHGLYKDGEKSRNVILTLPIYHIAGLLLSHTVLYQRLTQVMIPRFEPLALMKAIQEYKPEVLFTVTQMNLSMMNHPDIRNYNLRSIKRNYIASLGVALTEDIATQWHDHVGEDCIVVDSGYGLTETNTANCFVPLDRPPKWGSAGISVYGEKIKIVSLQDRNQVMPVGESGEIAVRTPSHFLGYWNKPKETTETLVDGWVFTGDVGKLDEEGYLYVQGRNKEMIKTNGLSVFPEEVELLLRKHPAIAECGVRGIPDAKKGEVIKAVVVLNEGFKEKVSAEEIINWAKDKMSFYKVPKVLEIRDALPIGVAGKKLRRLL